MPPARFGLPKSHRLLTRPEFARVLDGQCRASDENFTAYGLPNELPYARLGMVVGKRFAHRAVDRNSLKRNIREAFRRMGESLNGFDIVVFTKAGATNQPGPKLQQMLTKLLERVNKKCANYC
jgi:ribonuclease P protein component